MLRGVVPGDTYCLGPDGDVTPEHQVHYSLIAEGRDVRDECAAVP